MCDELGWSLQTLYLYLELNDDVLSTDNVDKEGIDGVSNRFRMELKHRSVVSFKDFDRQLFLLLVLNLQKERREGN